MRAGNLKYFLILSLTFGTTPASAALDVKHAIKVFLWACMNRGISRGQQSGYENDRAVLAAIGISKTDGTSSYYDSSPWHATYPFLMARNKGEYQLSVDDRIYAEGVRFDGLDTLNTARNQPMVPVQTSGGAYIVLSSRKPAPLWSGYLEYYCVFADRERADEFIRTHRFVVEQR